MNLIQIIHSLYWVTPVISLDLVFTLLILYHRQGGVVRHLIVPPRPSRVTVQPLTRQGLFPRRHLWKLRPYPVKAGMVLNINSVISESKRSELANLVNYVKRDAIIMTENKLCPEVASSEFMPAGYGKPLRKDFKKAARGVLITVKSCYNLTAVDLPSGKQDIIWGEVSLRNGKKLLLGAFYGAPSGKPENQLDDLEASLNDLRKITRNRRHYSYSRWGFQFWRHRLGGRISSVGIQGCPILSAPTWYIKWQPFISVTAREHQRKSLIGFVYYKSTYFIKVHLHGTQHFWPWRCHCSWQWHYSHLK